jgi:hypothetical protein
MLWKNSIAGASMIKFRICWAMGLLVLAALAAGTAMAAPISYLVTVNTSSLAGQSGFVDFQFNPGGLDTQPAAVTIANFTTDGTLSGSPAVVGDVSGQLPSTVTIVNSGGFNDYFEGLIFGTVITFALNFDGPALAAPNGTALSSSAFGLSFYDDTATLPLLTTDPFGFAAIVDVNLDGTTTPTTFPATSDGDPAVTIAVGVSEPTSLVLMLSGLLFSAGRRCLRL